jgi:acetyl-CoA acyltransferase
MASSTTLSFVRRVVSSGGLLGGRISSTNVVTATRALSSTATSTSTSSSLLSKHNSPDAVVLVAGVRLPFSLTSTIYEDQLAVDLLRLAFQGLITQTALDTSVVDYVIGGNVIQEVKTSNIAREAAMNAGLPLHIGAHTIAQACISSNAAICTGAEKILAGQASVIMAGGAETFSDVPIRLTRPIRQKLITMNRAMKKGGTLGAIRHMLKGLSMKDLALETPAIANYTTGEVMGVSSDRLAAKFGVSREEQDQLAVRSHVNAAAAHESGFYDNEVIPYKGSTAENGIKADTTIESVRKLKPAFVKPHGTHTAANSSFLTDGASATLIMSERKALELGYKPLAYIRDWSFKACDPFDELLLGPTYCSQQILSRNNMNMETDVGVYEIHEAFAGQLLSNLTAMASQQFADEKFNGKRIGTVDMDKMNTKGGSLALGHPFGATGCRLVTTASKRLQQEQQRFALIAACADGGMGHACLLERYDNN